MTKHNYFFKIQHRNIRVIVIYCQWYRRQPILCNH